MENLQDLIAVVWEWNFIPLGLGLVLLAVVGSGWPRRRLGKAWFVLGLALFGVSLYLGVARHEWGEVLFNGQLL